MEEAQSQFDVVVKERAEKEAAKAAEVKRLAEEELDGFYDGRTDEVIMLFVSSLTCVVGRLPLLVPASRTAVAEDNMNPLTSESKRRVQLNECYKCVRSLGPLPVPYLQGCAEAGPQPRTGGGVP